MITAKLALQAIEHAQKKAEELKVKVSITVVDDHGEVIATSRMDGAFVISPQFAQVKAYTSATLRWPTSALAEYTQPGKPYYGLTDLFGGELTDIAGGIPVNKGETTVGAVGVGGSPDVSLDEQCAKEAVKFLEEQLK